MSSTQNMFLKTSDSNLIKEALTHIQSGNFSSDTNQVLYRNILFFIAAASNRKQLIKDLRSFAAELKMENTPEMKDLVKRVKDPDYCDDILIDDFSCESYTNATFKANMAKALDDDRAGLKAEDVDITEYSERFSSKIGR